MPFLIFLAILFPRTMARLVLTVVIGFVLLFVWADFERQSTEAQRPPIPLPDGSFVSPENPDYDLYRDCPTTPYGCARHD